MIGINIRGTRHLMRLASTSQLQVVFINFRECGLAKCKIIKTENHKKYGDTLFIFNNYVNHHCFGNTMSILSDFEKLTSHNLSNDYGKVLAIQKGDYSLNGIMNSITLMPNDFDDSYEIFLKENKKIVKTIQDKHGIDVHDCPIQYIYILCNGSRNFFEWAVNAFCRLGVRMHELTNIFIWHEYYGQMTKNLSKGTITAYNSREQINLLKTEMTVLRREKRINDAINSFNTAQKKLFKNANLSDKDKEALNKFAKLSEVKRINFIKKVSSINTIEELLTQLKFVTSIHFDWNRDSFIEYLKNVEGNNYKVIYEKDNIFLLQVFDYETVKRLAKTTNWCISKNKSYWNNYVEHISNATQYVVFDFSKVEDDNLSIIGFTVQHNKGITNAHDFTNNDLMRSDDNAHLLLKSFISKFMSSSNIYTILSMDGIDINLVAKYDIPLFDWDRESVFNYLYECVNKENVITLCDKNNKVALSITDSNVRYFLGDAYIDNVSSECWDNQHIIFLDFNRSKYDTNKLQYAIIDSNVEDNVMLLYNEHARQSHDNFDTKLNEFGLPYDIIRRTNDDYIKLKDAIFSFNTPIIKDILNNAKDRKSLLIETINDYVGNDTFSNLLNTTLSAYMSFDYLDILYDSGCHLNEVISASSISDILRRLLNTIYSVDREENYGKVPTDDEITSFYEETLDSRDKALYVGCYLIICKIINNEKTDQYNISKMYKKVCSTILSYSRNDVVNPIFDDIMSKVGTNLDLNNKSETSMNYVKYVALYASDELKSTLKDYVEENGNSWLKQTYHSILSGELSMTFSNMTFGLHA